jgi:hypothetical protein
MPGWRSKSPCSPRSWIFRTKRFKPLHVGPTTSHRVRRVHGRHRRFPLPLTHCDCGGSRSSWCFLDRCRALRWMSPWKRRSHRRWHKRLMFQRWRSLSKKAPGQCPIFRTRHPWSSPSLGRRLLPKSRRLWLWQRISISRNFLQRWAHRPMQRPRRLPPVKPSISCSMFRSRCLNP